MTSSVGEYKTNATSFTGDVNRLVIFVLLISVQLSLLLTGHMRNRLKEMN
ncbi:hypothetical protein WUBG_03685 [Wuchereria bancrofti]|uniref:Uncharacterized protein n=1 Tax=Wuchereria bancrofti TaxID=6293 RepID=J9BDV8_WUCBA|nr:hypothetical protein WUBG_03685 [Wuchereria bancrofti]